MSHGSVVMMFTASVQQTTHLCSRGEHCYYNFVETASLLQVNGDSFSTIHKFVATAYSGKLVCAFSVIIVSFSGEKDTCIPCSSR